VVVEKDVSTSSNDAIGDNVHNSNEIPNNPKKFSLITYVPPLPFPQRIAQAKLD